MTEPNPNSPPVRAWQDGTPPRMASLQEVRDGMRPIDDQLVDLLFERLGFVLEAALFKLDSDQVQAPAQQASNIEKAVERARVLAPENVGFQEMVRSVWEVLVPGFVSLQVETFPDTYLIDPTG
jgi:isochorismate pyruvate lyase